MTKLPKITGPNQVFVSATELAEAVGVCRRTVGNWEATGFIQGNRPPGAIARRGRSILRYDLWLVLQALRKAA